MPTPKKDNKQPAKPSKPKAKESKTDIFLRLAKPRVEKVLKSLRILANCSNRSNYEYTQEQVDKICERINNATLEMASKFSKSKKEIESFEF